MGDKEIQFIEHENVDLSDLHQCQWWWRDGNIFKKLGRRKENATKKVGEQK